MYEKSKILHRDISVGNVMFHRHKEQIIGVLCDWDLAYDFSNPTAEKRRYNKEPSEDNEEADIGDEIPESEDSDADESSGDDEKTNDSDDHEMDSDDQPPPTQMTDSEDPPRPQYRTGTGPFMAYELLLTGEVPLHIYRFDLESFFWLLAWFCAVFDPVGHAYVRHAPWEQNTLYRIGDAKREFLMRPTSYTLTFQNADPRYHNLIRDWVRKLRQYFRCILEDEYSIASLQVKIQDAVECKNHKDESTYRNKLADLMESRKDIVTYESFMKILGVEETKW